MPIGPGRPDPFGNLVATLDTRPHAVAALRGDPAYPQLHGTVRFYQTDRGVLVATEVFGLPISTARCADPIFAFHIHAGDRCSGNADDPFADALTHYDPDDCPHPYHAGDLPSLFGNSGYAFSVVLTERFRVDEIIGRVIILHASPDDFTTQPSGNAGEKIACGRIRARTSR